MPTTSTVLPTNSYGPGTISFGPVNVPTGLTGVEVRIARVALLSESLSISWKIELSQDDGANWLSWGAAGTGGGVALDEQGQPIPFSHFTVDLPNPTNNQRRLRGSMTLSEAATTSVAITTTP